LRRVWIFRALNRFPCLAAARVLDRRGAVASFFQRGVDVSDTVALPGLHGNVIALALELPSFAGRA